MSNTKIVIDKDVFENIFKMHESNNNRYGEILKLIAISPEIQIDQSIEERAEKYGCGFTLPKVGYIEGATQQQIIGQLKVKEKDYEFEHHCGNKVTKKEVFHDHCLKCGEYFEDIEP